jgi:signal transduction histidine kinase
MHTLTDLCQIARGLHPRELDGGLPHALASLAERCPVRVELRAGAVPSAPEEIAAAAYFVCAEALANVAKHAGASSVHLEVVECAGALRVDVTDDGTGGADPSRGSGLRGLIDRVEALGGTLTVSSPEGGGTRLAAELPLGRLPA